MFSVQSDLLKAMAKLDAIGAKQLPFAASKAINSVAYKIQSEVKKNMPERFTLRRQWVVQGIVVEKSTKQNLTATVRSRDKFMGLQEFGGQKNPLRNYLAVPTKAVRRTKTDLISKADRPSALGAKAHIVDVKGTKYLALKKPRKGKNSNELRLLYMLIPRAQIKKRLGLQADGEKIAKENFSRELAKAIDYAIRTAR